MLIMISCIIDYVYMFVGGERILKEVMPCHAVEDCQVPSKIAKEVDDERQRDSGRKKQQQQNQAGSVDRSGRPTCTACTGP